MLTSVSISRPSVIERMAAYQRATGLKPTGRHRPTADTLLRELSHRCTNCGGRQIFRVAKAWIWCEACGGLGRVMTPKARRLLQQRVAERSPGAVVGGEAEQTQA
jgi:hypothetical protein